MDLASLHLRIWKLHIGLDVEIEDAEEREEPAPPMGFGSPIDVPEVEEDGDVEERLGFRC